MYNENNEIINEIDNQNDELITNNPSEVIESLTENQPIIEDKPIEKKKKKSDKEEMRLCQIKRSVSFYLDGLKIPDGDRCYLFAQSKGSLVYLYDSNLRLCGILRSKDIVYKSNP